MSALYDSNPAMTVARFTDLLQTDFTPGAGDRWGTVVYEERLYREALELAFHTDPRISFRASYSLEKAFFRDPVEMMPHIPLFVENYLSVTNGSAHRHYAKIMAYLLKNNMFDPDPVQLEQIVGRTFDWLLCPGEKPAVKVWAMEILLLLSDHNGWIVEELYHAVHRLMAEGSPALQSHGAKVCRKLRRKLA